MGVDLKQFRSCGRNVKIDPSVVIEHPECYHDEITDVPMALSGEKTAPITVGEDVWIAANAVIAAGTRIADGCVIAANAVVTKDAAEPYAVYAGVPARFLRSRKTAVEFTTKSTKNTSE